MREAARATEGRVVAIEDHWPEGGFGGAVLTALSAESGPLHFEHLAVGTMPSSGSSQELMDAAGISSNHIVEAARRLPNAWRTISD